ncbi:MAG: hypothetical protein COB23_03170 [Methylophaga sp.]|nr:MAG: hypothetical protein COB23_03170 [Methylophaga sp.]
MGTLSNQYPTLADLSKRMDDKGDIVDIIEILNETNPILKDMPFFECNQGTKHLTSIRSGLPKATWRRLYQGVQPQKGTVTQVEDTTGMLEQWSEIDAKLVDISNNPNRFRMGEGMAAIEGMNNDMATGVFYANLESDPEQIGGLSGRFNDLNADNASQIIDGGGTGSNNTSIWLIVWSERTVHGIYPKGTQAGIQREDKGKTTKDMVDGSVMDVYREKFNWDCGVSVRDWRYVVRIANIDIDDLKASNIDMFRLLRKGYYALKQRQIAGGRPAIYCNSDVLEALDAQTTPTLATSGTTTSGNVRLSTREVEGEEVMFYRKMPLRETDALINNEARVIGL